LRSALNGASEERPELAASAIPLEVVISPLSVREQSRTSTWYSAHIDVPRMASPMRQSTDLRRVRTAVGSPDSITASAVSARDEIGRAIAARIRETSTAAELAVVTEEVLPEIEKFLESPDEKRLRRMRAGTILSSIGIGTAIAISLVSLVMKDNGVIFLAGLGLVAFFIGLGFILNGMFLTVPKGNVLDRSPDADSQRELDAAEYIKPELPQPTAQSLVSSVTEHTTKNLEKESN
ncbi:MAG: hypothetical protein ABL984_04470, partial [Pyrinomonadaceae bacterium]